MRAPLVGPVGMVPGPTKPVAIGLAAIALVAVAATGVVVVDEVADPQQTSYVRVAHVAPDAPTVDVHVDNETVLTNVTNGTVSEYLELSAGPHNLSITESGADGEPILETTVDVEPRTATTIAVATNASANQPDLVPLSDDALAPGENSSALRFVHLVDGAPAVNLTTETDNGTVVLAENLSEQNASSYVTVPAGNHSIDVRLADAEADGEPLTTIALETENGSAHSVLLIPNASDDGISHLRTTDATITIELPGTES